MRLLLGMVDAAGDVVPAALGNALAVLFDELPAVTPRPLEFWVLAVLAVIADVRPFPALAVNRRFPTVHLSVCFTFAIMLIWGVVPAILVQLVALLVAAARLRVSPAWTGFTMVRLTSAFLVANVVLELARPHAFIRWVNETGAIVLVATAMVWFLVSYLLLIAGLWLRYRTRWRRILRRTFGHELLASGALLLLSPVFVDAPTGWGILFVMVPLFAVMQLVRMSAEREKQLRHDPLTGLLGRRGLAAEMEALIAVRPDRRRESPRSRFALFLLDLDRFKAVNDTLGHAVGDRLLVAVAQRLRAAVRPDDQVARLGGDEFAILASEVASEAQARALACRVGEALTVPVRMDGLLLDVSASIGVSIHPDHGADVAALLRQADVAMYEAKRAGDTVAVYSPRSDNNSPERLSLLADLRRALWHPGRRSEIQYHYQPQVAIDTGEVVGVEALLRWRHPARGQVAPAEVVQIAEHSDVMQLLTLRAVDEVIDQLAEWNAAGLRTRVSINMSVRDLHTMTLADHLAERLRGSRVAPEQVEVEITETAFMADWRLVQRAVKPLAELGVGVALDDLGTGYSSLQHLRQLPLTEVKVDASFVQTMATNPDDETIVRSVIELAHALGLRVVAEGVEDAAVHQMLAEAGCDVGQGWHYAPAMPADQLKAWLAARINPTNGHTPSLTNLTLPTAPHAPLAPVHHELR